MSLQKPAFHSLMIVHVIDSKEGVSCLVDESAKARLARAQLLLRLSQLRDVLQNAKLAQSPSRSISANVVAQLGTSGEIAHIRAALDALDFSCLPPHTQVEFTGRAGSCIRKIPCVGRKRKRNASQVIHLHPRRNCYCGYLGNLYRPFANNMTA
jgi:hypothetical protein